MSQTEGSLKQSGDFNKSNNVLSVSMEELLAPLRQAVREQVGFSSEDHAHFPDFFSQTNNSGSSTSAILITF